MPSAYHNKHVCVTGGAGFIGSHLVDALVERGAHVTVIDDLSNGYKENLSSVAEKIQFVHASILDADTIAKAVQECEIVFHHAAIASVPQSVEHPDLYFETNVTGTMNVLDAARTNGVKRIVYAASSSAYGESEELPKVETMMPSPISPYAASKLAGEVLLHSYCHCYNLTGISLRYFNIFGPRQRADSQYAAVIPRFIEAYLNGKKPTIFGTGEQTRDFTHVSNAVHACLLASSCETELHGEVVNIACGQRYSLLQLVDTIANHLGVKCEYELAPPRPGDVMHSLADITAARKLINFIPTMDFNQGLAHTVSTWTKAVQSHH